MKRVVAGLILGINATVFAQTENFDPLSDVDVGVVLTPTRLRQSIADTPASVTVITADMLAKFGITSIPEALRLVPGMAVMQLTNNDYRINYQGTNIYAPRRMNVLIDGMSVYQPAFAFVNWTALPVSMEDIQRIEVTRGPNSASYGPNSMLAIINIITKEPKSVEGSQVTISGGTNDTASVSARYAAKPNENTSYRITLERQQSRGVDNVRGYIAGQKNILEQHDGSKIDRLNLRSVTEISKKQTLDFQVAALSGVQEQQFADDYQLTYPDVRVQEYEINAVWKNIASAAEEYKVQATASEHNNSQAWTNCFPTLTLLPEMGALWRSNPNYVNTILKGKVPSGGSAEDNRLAQLALQAIQSLGARAAQPNCGIANQNYTERRLDVELQSTFVLSDALRLVSGLGARQDLATSQTYLNGSVENSSFRMFANAEFRPIKDVVVNAGGYYENDQLTGESFSPRIAINKHLDGNNTIRFIVSSANRMPNIIEKRADWSYLIAGLVQPVNGQSQAYFTQTSRSTGDLQAEKILSKEMGYTGNFPQHGLMLDVKLFENNLSNLISERLQLNNNTYSNQGEAHLRGAEFQVGYQPSPDWLIHFAYAYLLNDAPTPAEQSQYSQNSGALAVTHLLQSGWRASIALYGYDSSSIGQSAYGRQDVILSKSHRISKNVSIEPSFTVSHLESRTVQYAFDVGRTAENSFPNQTRYIVGAKLTF